MLRLLTVLALTSLLGACVTPPVYEPPRPGQPAAEIIVPKESGFSFVLLDENGCYRGEKYINASEAPGFRIPAGQTTVFNYGKTAYSKTCRMMFSFKPEADGHYHFLDWYAKETNANASEISKFMGTDTKDLCKVLVVKKDENGIVEPVKTFPVKMRQSGLTCIKPR